MMKGVFESAEGGAQVAAELAVILTDLSDAFGSIFVSVYVSFK
jgi:hypothetical protein